MPRLIIAAVVAASLSFASSARAEDVSVTLPAPATTNAPSIDIVVSPAGTSLQCRVDDQPFADCTSSWHPVVSGDGVHTYDVTAGGYVFSSHFTLDRTAPAITITSGADDGAEQALRSAAYAFTVSDGAYSCTWDGAPVACDGGFSAENLAVGTHTLTISATDAVGNTASLTRHLTIVQALTSSPDRAPVTPSGTPVPSEGGVLSAGAANATALVSVKKRTRSYTRLKSLTLRNVPAGTTIKVSCKGKGCPSKATRQTAARSGKVAIKGIAGRRLRPGAVITLTLSRASAKPQTIRILVRSTRAPKVS